MLPNGESSSRNHISIFLKAIPNTEIGEDDKMNRDCDFKFWHYNNEKLVGNLRSAKIFTNTNSEWGFGNFLRKDLMLQAGLHKNFYIEISLKSIIPAETLASKLKITAGLKNEGTTCYINSLLQNLFIIAPFRKAMFKMPTSEANTIPLALQRIFYNLQFSKHPISTSELIRAFGWGDENINAQHDINEFSSVL